MKDERARSELARLTATRANVARSRFARAMSAPWRAAMVAIGVTTFGAAASGFYLFANGGDVLLSIALVSAFPIGLTVLGMVAILYPGERGELEQAIDEGSRALESQVQGVKARLDLATSKGNRSRGPYAAGESGLGDAEVETAREELAASIAEIDRVRRR